MAKLYQVVNENDEIVGHKLREEIDSQTDYYRTAALWLKNSKGQVLIAQRTLTKDKDPGKWGPAAAGTLEKGETYETSMDKEAEEEIGLAGVDFAVGPKQVFRKPRHSICQWFFAVADKDEREFRLQEDEVSKVAWVDEDWLKRDVGQNPDKYLPTMSEIIKVLCKG